MLGEARRAGRGGRGGGGGGGGGEAGEAGGREAGGAGGADGLGAAWGVAAVRHGPRGLSALVAPLGTRGTWLLGAGANAASTTTTTTHHVHNDVALPRRTLRS